MPRGCRRAGRDEEEGMAQKQAEEDLSCKSPCPCSALGCHAGRAAGAGSGCDTGEDGAGSPAGPCLGASTREHPRMQAELCISL